MEIELLIRQFNWIDWVVLLFVLLAIVSGIQRGFLLGALDLLGLAVGMAAAMVAYRAGADVLLDLFAIPEGVAHLAAFFGTFLLAQVLYHWIVGYLSYLAAPLVTGPLSTPDRLLGAIPGSFKGLVIAAALLLPFAMLPLSPAVAAEIERSYLASEVVDATLDLAAEMDAQLGRDLSAGLSFLAPPQTEQGRQITFGRLGELRPDPAAEQRMLELVNQERARQGLQPLEVDEEMREVARRYSHEMFEHGHFGHQSPVSGSPVDRLLRGGIRFSLAGENLAYAPNVEVAHRGLMDSPGHRENILRPAYGRIGIGVVRSEFRGSMFTQVFAN